MLRLDVDEPVTLERTSRRACRVFFRVVGAHDEAVVLVGDVAAALNCKYVKGGGGGDH